MKNVSYHEVTAIDIDNISTNDLHGKPFYSRALVITMADGSRERLALFSPNGYNLLIDDRELDGMKSDDLLKAA